MCVQKQKQTISFKKCWEIFPDCVPLFVFKMPKYLSNSQVGMPSAPSPRPGQKTKMSSQPRNPRLPLQPIPKKHRGKQFNVRTAPIVSIRGAENCSRQEKMCLGSRSRPYFTCVHHHPSNNLSHQVSGSATNYPSTGHWARQGAWSRSLCKLCKDTGK